MSSDWTETAKTGTLRIPVKYWGSVVTSPVLKTSWKKKKSTAKCSTSSFSLSGNLTLVGSGVWIFKTVSTLITSPGSSVTGGDPCNVWWRIGSSTTLDTTTSFIGTVISQNGVNAMNTGATLDGRFLGLSAATVTLDGNTITGPTCASSGGSSGSSSGGSSSGSSSSAAVPKLPNTGLGPNHRSSVLRSMIIPIIGAVTVLNLLYLVRRKRADLPKANN